MRVMEKKGLIIVFTKASSLKRLGGKENTFCVGGGGGGVVP